MKSKPRWEKYVLIGSVAYIFTFFDLIKLYFQATIAHVFPQIDPSGDIDLSKLDTSFSKFLESFKDFKSPLQSEVPDDGNIETPASSKQKSPPSASGISLYKDQLEAALKKQNFSMQDYLEVRIILHFVWITFAFNVILSF